MLYFTHCKDCTDRTMGCHDHCERYLQEKRAYEEAKEREKLDELSHYESDRRFTKQNKQLRKYGKSYL